MKNLSTYFVCLALVFSFSCQTEAIEVDAFQLDDITNQSNAGQDDDDDAPEEEESCETLFAIGGEDNSTCFLDDGFNRWGWTIGPLSGGDYSFDLYSGAGQCDTDKGTHVGTISVNYDEGLGTVDVNFDMFDGFVLNETHLYVGELPYPTDNNGNPTVAPGQYPHQNALDDASSDAYSLTDVSGEIFIIAHGVSCEDDDDDNDNGGGGVF
ncbi:hypothetical protein [Winogradskyella alexanderae]|uniref:Uncharacterized protein n=1 Tax=Winogradskyella alexanderae TaxID=2877123 RepID=A0ABS7XST3_9FLAO|nr:hypothetical protein [Winogradskyella alexanderae]MCA0131906.1 hypothetical protein [Winogradskyella alexanderae]